MLLKIGNHEYEITARDRFMDNGACVQLLTQNKERFSWGHTPNPVLSKRAVKQIAEYDRVQVEHGHGEDVEVFRLLLPVLEIGDDRR